MPSTYTILGLPRVRPAVLIAGVLAGFLAGPDAGNAAAPSARKAAKPVPAGQSCSVRQRGRLVDVDCPRSTLSGVLQAFEKAFGLRSEYPRELAAVPVSVKLRRSTPDDALRVALTQFNFAVWQDASAPSVNWVTVVGARPAIEQAMSPLAAERSAIGSSPAAFPERKAARSSRRVGRAPEEVGDAAPGGSPVVQDTATHQPVTMPYSETVEAPAGMFRDAGAGSPALARAQFSDIAPRPPSLVAVPVDPQLGPRLQSQPVE